MNSIDLRRFEYALAPLQRQRQWQLDALRRELGELQRRIDEQEDVLSELRGQHQDWRARALQLLDLRLDPAAHKASLLWSTQLLGRIAKVEDRLTELHADRRRLMARCLELQRQLDALDAHRENCLSTYLREEGARQAAQADRDWLMRTAAAPRSPWISEEMPS